MKMSAQIIEMNGTPAFAVVPVAEWTALLERLARALGCDMDDLHAGH